ncbi:MAG: hypothetical protein RPS47_02845 [Colwellia sp.]|jgi:CMP-N-acetylneuraminic acid synthetase
MNVAIIPARGGSKRIPKKKIKNIMGKSMMAYLVKAVIDSGYFDSVLASADGLHKKAWNS